jgi:phenylacetate-CoA ligase
MRESVYRHAYELVQAVTREKVFEVLLQMEASQWLDTEAIRAAQWRKLGALVRHAHAHVPFYRERFERAGLRPELIRDWPDLERLPILTKEDLRTHRDRLMARDRRYATTAYYSSGSTGPSAVVLVDRHAAAYRHAAVFRTYRWMGSNIGAGVLQFWGTQLDPLRRAKERLRDLVMHRATVSTHRLDDAHFRRAYRTLTRLKPSILYGFASALHEFARFLQSSGLPLDRAGVKGVLATGEPLLPHQRACLEQVFSCRAFVQYGAEEFGPIAYECPEGSLHVVAENVHVEQEPGSERDGRGGLLITSLNNHVMPLIRYRLGDVGILSADTCVCGRGLPILKEISGRSVDFIRTPDGKLLHGINFDYLPKHFLEEIRQFQIVQTTADTLQVNVVRDAGFRDDTLARFERQMRGIVGGELKIGFELWSEIPRSRSGKAQFVQTLLEPGSGPAVPDRDRSRATM